MKRRAFLGALGAGAVVGAIPVSPDPEGVRLWDSFGVVTSASMKGTDVEIPKDGHIQASKGRRLGLEEWVIRCKAPDEPVELDVLAHVVRPNEDPVTHLDVKTDDMFPPTVLCLDEKRKLGLTSWIPMVVVGELLKVRFTARIWVKDDGREAFRRA